MKGQIDIAEEQVKLARALSLPKFNIGYMSEKIIGEHFQGVTVGVSIPLWENKNSQKFAKARMKTTQVMLDDSKVQFYNNLQRLYLKASALEKNLDKFKQSISTSRNDTLLKIALDKGEISLLDYLLEIGHYYDAVIKILETERDYELAVAEFMAIELL
jgi:outer membrane protein TolC